MRTGLLSELVAVGYEIYLEGDYVKLLYRKPDTPPDKVRPLIEELRKCKAEVMDILKRGNNFLSSPETAEPTKMVKVIWSVEMQPLVDWFSRLEPPKTPFYLEPHRQIVDVKKFFTSLLRNIESGPDGPRGQTGALCHDLKMLKAKLN